MSYLDKHLLDTTNPREPNYGEVGDPAYDEYQRNWRNDPYYQEWLDAYTLNLSRYWPELETDMHINTMRESKYLKKEDVTPDKLVTIKSISQENLAMENQPEELKYVLYIVENLSADGSNKPIVLNWTNIQLCAQATGSEDTDDWPEKKIVLYNDPNVSFGGKLTGGIRIRKAKNKIEPQSEPPVDFDDDVGF